MSFLSHMLSRMGITFRVPATYLKYTHSIYVNRPITVTAPYLLQLENHKSWVPRLISSHPLSKGPMETGSRYFEVFKHGKNKEGLKTVVTSFQPLKKLSTTGISYNTWMRKTLHFEPILHGTRIYYSEEIKRGGVKAFFTERFHMRHHQKQIDSKFAKLKLALEAHREKEGKISEAGSW